MKKILVIALLVLTAVYLVGSVTRTISDSQDNKETFIRNSKGNYWEPTGANIQIAIDDLGSGGMVFLPIGVLEISIPIYLNDNVRLVGSGTGSTILRMKDNANIVYILLARGKHHFTISDLTVDSNYQNNPNDGECIRCDQNSEDFIIENVHLMNARDSALYLGDVRNGMFSNIHVTKVKEWHGINMYNVDSSVFSDCIIEGVDDGYALDMHGIHGCTFNNFVTESFWGIKTSGDAAYNCSFNNFDIALTDDSEGHYGLKMDFLDGSNFNNIRIRGSNTGIRAGSSCFNSNFNNIIITSPAQHGIVWTGGRNLTFGNMQILDPGGDGINGGSSAGEASFSNVIIEKAGYGIRFNGVNNVILSDIDLMDSDTYGIYLNGVSDVTINGCLVRNTGSKGIYVSGLSTSESYSIADCVIHGTTYEGIHVADENSDSFIITNNIITDTGSQAIRDDSTTINKIITKNIE